MTSESNKDPFTELFRSVNMLHYSGKWWKICLFSVTTARKSRVQKPWRRIKINIVNWLEDKHTNFQVSLLAAERCQVTAAAAAHSRRWPLGTLPFFVCDAFMIYSATAAAKKPVGCRICVPRILHTTPEINDSDEVVIWHNYFYINQILIRVFHFRGFEAPRAFGTFRRWQQHTHNYILFVKRGNVYANVVELTKVLSTYLSVGLFLTISFFRLVPR